MPSRKEIGYRWATVVFLGLAVGVITHDVRNICFHLLTVAPMPSIIQQHVLIGVTDKIVKEEITIGLPSHIAIDRAWMESKFNAHALSPPDRDGGRDHGPMQLHDKFKWPLGALTDTDLNIKAGVGFLYKLWNACDHQTPCVHRAYVTGRIVRDP